MVIIKRIVEFDKHFTDTEKLVDELINHIQEKEILKRKEIFVEIANAEIKEVSEKYFTGETLLNSAYVDLIPFDFESFDILFRTYNKFPNETICADSKKKLYTEILKGKNQLPILLKGTNNRYWQLSGNNEMLGYKLWAIAPTIKVINIQSEII